MINLFQQRDFGNKINATAQYITANFRSLGMALLYIVGPVALVTGIASGIAQSNMLRFVRASTSDNPDPTAALQMLGQFFSPVFWITALLGILANVMVALTTYAHMKRYASATDQRTTPLPVPGVRTPAVDIPVAEVWAAVQPAIGRGLIVSILCSIVAGVGFLFFFIPGIYVAVVFSLALAVTSFEGSSFGSTWERCFALIGGKWWSTLGLIIVVGIITFIVGLIFTLPGGLTTFLVSARLLPDVSTFWLVVANVIAIIGRTMLNAIIYVAIGFQYTNLVERQEGRGLLSAIDAIGTGNQPRAQDEGEY